MVAGRTCGLTWFALFSQCSLHTVQNSDELPSQASLVCSYLRAQHVPSFRLQKSLWPPLRARAQVLDYEEGPAAVADEELQTELREINANSRLSQQYLDLARDLDVMEPKLPDEVRHV